MPHRRLAVLALILARTLVKASSAATSSHSDVRIASTQRSLLQSVTVDYDTCEAIDEYDPVLDSPVELQSLTALYRATGGPYWTYDSFFQTRVTASSLSGLVNETAEASLRQRFNRTAWLDFSVSYCQWYACMPARTVFAWVATAFCDSMHH